MDADSATDATEGSYPPVRCDKQSEGRIVVDTTRWFKRLERPVVVIVATPESVTDKTPPYVALSRAHTQLVIAGTPRVSNRMSNRAAAPAD